MARRLIFPYFNWPTRTGLACLRVTDGLSMSGVGLVLVPVVLAKRGRLMPKLFTWLTRCVPGPRCSSVSLILLIVGGIRRFELADGNMNIQYD